MERKTNKWTLEMTGSSWLRTLRSRERGGKEGGMEDRGGDRVIKGGKI